jgi:hypothetical protein
MTTTPEAATDRMPEGPQELLSDLTAINDGRSPSHDLRHIEALGLVERVAGCSLLTTAGSALWSLLNAADMIQQAERDIAAAGYMYSAFRATDGVWRVTLHRYREGLVLPCAFAPTLAAAMWEARSTAIARRL